MPTARSTYPVVERLRERSVKQIAVGRLKLSKVVCGSNPFYGHSHFSEARNAEYLNRFDDEAIERIIRRCLASGVNAVESSANKRIISILSKVRDGHPSPVHFVGSTRIDETSKMKSHRQKLSFLIEHRADICVVHAQYVDRPREGGDSLNGLPDFVGKIHEAGLLAGISSHRVETIQLCERLDCGIDVYVFPLNMSGFVYPGYDGDETPQQRIDLVRSVAKPFILIKTLGAGRIPPTEALPFVLENSKPNDLLLIGFSSEREVDESIRLVEKYAAE